MVGCTALWGWCYLVTCVFLTVVRNKGCGGIVQTHFIFSEFNGRQGEVFFSLLSRWETCLLDLLLQFFTLCSNQFSWPFVTCQVVFVESAPPFFLQHHRMNFIVFCQKIPPSPQISVILKDLKESKELKELKELKFLKESKDLKELKESKEENEPKKESG